MYNNAREIIEAHLVSQKERLLRTIAGRCVLERLGYSVRKTSALTKIPTRIQETMHVSPIPRNMHPNFHIGRRQARAQALARKYENHPNVLYVDAASTARSTAFVTSVVDNHGTEINASSVSRVSAAEAEELAIALAITTRPHWDCVIVLTDSQTACRNYSRAIISRAAHRILNGAHQLPPYIQIVWTPGHESLRGNQQAHACARAHALREPRDGRAEQFHPEPIPLTYTHILQHYRLSRRTLPPPHNALTREEAVIWRKLQTNTYPHLSLYHAIHPALYSYKCPHCDQCATLYHMVWACANTPQLTPITHPTTRQWEAALSSSDSTDQLNLVNRARRAAKAAGLLD